MRKYEFLEHTADVKFKAFGKNINECFANAALALTDVVIDVKKVKEKEEKLIEVQSENMKALLYDFLERILVIMETDDFAVSKVKSIQISKQKKFKLIAAISGDTGVEKYNYKRDVKAVTYNEMIIDEKGKFVQVVLDL